MMHKKWVIVLLLGVLAFALAACGGDKNNSGSADSGNTSEQPIATQEIIIKATNWAFDKPEYIVPKDTPVKITLELDGGHGIKVKGTDINLGPGNTSTVVTLKEGVYDFNCSIICGKGHSDMVSKLVVQ